ncbi:hypothetical protein [Laspinema olomoucense]|uniref:hypothetical protein n=1 Tax=Laspinema olomoucense TaxID=3231600 RepID=UPI0021BA6C73|nr:hypothetical protein [Laspinema sp. D3d]MCT7971163.1 hypothetical protein [Laspinema sp. D3d]
MDDYCLFTPVRLSTGKPAPITQQLQIEGYGGELEGYLEEESRMPMMSDGAVAFLNDKAYLRNYVIAVEKLPGFIEGFTKPHVMWGDSQNPFFDWRKVVSQFQGNLDTISKGELFTPLERKYCEV